MILDVVYDHFGPDGNHLNEFSPDCYRDKHEGEWGKPINFEGEKADGTRILPYKRCLPEEEFHLDGLRLDATQAILAASPEHIIMAIGERVRAKAHGRR